MSDVKEGQTNTVVVWIVSFLDGDVRRCELGQVRLKVWCDVEEPGFRNYLYLECSVFSVENEIMLFYTFCSSETKTNHRRFELFRILNFTQI